ncbi:MAG: A/G-specific adenine glycosylase [Magnetococcales bacterium]|nr:A/G-specific adenine glycosylase [Magnetococcales bacterium]
MEALNDPAIRTRLAQELLAHYGRNGRDLPWRRTRDPYCIWLAEIMLQQTGVKSVVPYFGRFITRFPTLPALAEAPLEAVLALWQGLGYYRRAQHLHAAAKAMVQHHQGRVPEDYATLVQLPGIGPSTAGAILAIAFDQHHAILDGNVKRVLTRLLAFDQPPDSTPGNKKLWEAARLLTPAGQAGTYAQAIMDLGAAVCRPRQPDCPACPWHPWCQANILGRPEAFPIPSARSVKPHKYQFNALVLRAEGRLLLLPKPAGGLLGGLWHPPGAEPGPTSTPPAPGFVAQWLRDHHGLVVTLPVALPPVDHIFTHFKLTVFPFFCAWRAGELPVRSEHRWIDPAQDRTTPISTLHRKVLAALPNQMELSRS